MKKMGNDLLIISDDDIVDGTFKIPNNTAKISHRAFAHCNELKIIDIPDCVKTIEASAFLWCINLENVNISNNVKVIRDSTFWGCESLTKINIPEGVKLIEDYVFKYCINLREITLPNSLKDISSNAFEDCDNLKIINISSYEIFIRLKNRYLQVIALNSIARNNQQFSADEMNEFNSYIKENKAYILKIILLENLRYLFNFMLENNFYTKDELLSMMDRITNDVELRVILLNHTKNNENNIELDIDDRFNLYDKPKEK